MTYRIELDEPKCVASGQCVMVAPDVFDQREDDGVAVVLDPVPPEHLIDDVRQAVTICPAAALRLVEP
jgi:ferredoxin